MQGQCVSLPSFYAHGHPAEICQLRLTGARRASWGTGTQIERQNEHDKK